MRGPDEWSLLSARLSESTARGVVSACEHSGYNRHPPGQGFSMLSARRKPRGPHLALGSPRPPDIWGSVGGCSASSPFIPVPLARPVFPVGPPCCSVSRGHLSPATQDGRAPGQCELVALTGSRVCVSSALLARTSAHRPHGLACAQGSDRTQDPKGWSRGKAPRSSSFLSGRQPLWSPGWNHPGKCAYWLSVPWVPPVILARRGPAEALWSRSHAQARCMGTGLQRLRTHSCPFPEK